jgi:hypothetical protein
MGRGGEPVKAVQLGLFTGEPVEAVWVLADNGRWWCARCLKVVQGPKPKRRCSCGWQRREGVPA